MFKLWREDALFPVEAKQTKEADWFSSAEESEMNMELKTGAVRMNSVNYDLQKKGTKQIPFREGLRCVVENELSAKPGTTEHVAAKITNKFWNILPDYPVRKSATGWVHLLQRRSRLELQGRIQRSRSIPNFDIWTD